MSIEISAQNVLLIMQKQLTRKVPLKVLLQTVYKMLYFKLKLSIQFENVYSSKLNLKKLISFLIGRNCGTFKLVFIS